MTLHALETAPGAWTLIRGSTVELPDQTVSAAWVDGLDENERAALGFVAVAEPEGMRPEFVTMAGVEDASGEPVLTFVLADLRTHLVAAVNARRDILIEGGFPFAGGVCQSRLTDQQNVSTLGVQAQLALAAGAEPGDLRWHGGDEDFAWIMSDNTSVALDAPGMVALLQTGMTFKAALTFEGRAKKDWLLDPARTLDDLLSYDVSAGWPAS